MYNYFEERFGRNYIKYEGENILVLNPSIFKHYEKIFTRTTNPKAADLLVVKGGMYTLYKLKSENTIRDLLLTQKNDNLLKYLENKCDFLLDMTLKECATCANCFDKRDYMSIYYLLMNDNHIMSLAENGCDELYLGENMKKYISEKYTELGRHALLIKQGMIKVWRN